MYSDRDPYRDNLANVFSARNGGRVVPVALQPVMDSYSDDFTLEPPRVKVLAGNDSLLYLNSENRGSLNPRSANPAEIVISAPGSNTLARKIKRMGLAYINFTHATPIINGTNNILYVYLFSTKTVYTVTVKFGNYTTPQLLYTALIAAFAEVPALAGQFYPLFKTTTTGLPDQAYYPFTDNKVTIKAFIPAYFLPQSPLMLRGKSTYNLPILSGTRWDGANPVLTGTPLAAEYDSKCSTFILSGAMSCRYTTYIDFHSQALTQWTKNPTNSSYPTTNTMIYRLYVPVFDGYDSDPGNIIIKDTGATPPIAGSALIYDREIYNYESAPIEISYWNYNTEENISNIDINVRDEYGSRFEGVTAVMENTSVAPVVIHNPDNWDNGIRYSIVIKTEA